MRGQIVRLTLVWMLLLAIAGGQFVISGVDMPRGMRPVLFVFALVMVGIIGFCFMGLGRMPVIARGFAAAAVFWLIVLFGIGMMDPLTRHLWGLGGPSPP